MLLSALYNFWLIFQACVAFVLGFPVLSFIIFRIKGSKKIIARDNTPNTDFAVIITAYKNSANLINVINSILKSDYDRYIIYVVADACPDFNPDINNEKVVILHPPTELANQVKSHFLAIGSFKRAHNVLTIIDSDNLVASNYLSALNRYFNSGYQAVQGVRKAKNLDTHYACIDAVNELYYLFYDRIILFNIGSSSMLSGSGMAFTVTLFKECMSPGKSSGAGFDKILQYEVVSRGHRIAFAEDAIVLDEKSAKADQIVKQRARWNNTWFRYVSYGFSLMWLGIKRFSINQFLYGFTLTRPPLFLLLILCAVLLFMNLFVSLPIVFLWIAGFCIFVAGFFLALKQLKADKRIYQALIHIPNFVALQIRSLLKARKANELSVATEHSYNKEIEKID
ncbi:MAG: glycosyltransferase [Chitinophagaceae bacterium]|nr:MAG: glycosyltransferase [Chitinophagaceae bacterium]